ncbi:MULTISPECIES: LysR family transcriptional regulator [Streptomyces]|uniref:LysR family transcriptional regulator n=1 Tax=Streptomyces nondiastaticus TaxID=3154512 RepID=A0ABW6TX40_9ACTN|nr:LysR family transcriptional regulator [Streptomyces sp. VNUA116]WKU46159.1 LysR family transcriptional regulator [Streptomyces sp. VNUA116]
MTLDDLKVFVMVCEARNLSAVAREMNCSQSAVSQHVRRLEKEVGLPLMERQPRGVVPTEAGRILQRAASDGLTALGEGLRTLEELRTGRGGGVLIATGATTIRHLMGAAIEEYSRRYPDVGLEFHTERSSHRCIDALRSGAVDLAWVSVAPDAHGVCGAQGVELRPVISLEWVLAVRPGDPLAAESVLGAADLARTRLIRPPAGTSSGRQVEDVLGAVALSSRATTRATDWDTALLLAELGLGHALIPAMPGLVGPSGAVRLIPVTGIPRLEVGWAARQWSALSPAAREFAAAVTRHVTAGTADAGAG